MPSKRIANRRVRLLAVNGQKGRQNMAEIYRALCIGSIALALLVRNEGFTLFTVVFTFPYWFEWICRKAGVK